MKKILFTISIFVLIALVFSSMALGVNAHPGRTDGSGGHTDSDTGEYHYHHGYSAHDHYDMDGDGDIDCPYDFDDQTGTNSGGNSGSNSSSFNYSSDNDNVIVRTETVTKTVTEEVPYIPTWVYWIMGILIVSVIIMFFVIRSKCKELTAQEQRFRQNAITEESRVKYGIIALHNALVEKYGEDYLYIISNAPDGDYIDDELLPHSANYSANPYCDRYTFFLGSSPYNHSSKYHHSSCRYCRSSLRINAYSLRKNRRYQACAICKPSNKLPNTEWVDKYIAHYNFLKKYIDLDKKRNKTSPQEKPTEDNNSSNPSVYISWRD